MSVMSHGLEIFPARARAVFLLISAVIAVAASASTESDFNGDNQVDILWRHNVAGRISMWQMSANAVDANLYVDTVTNVDWQIVGIADYNGDSDADILWRNLLTGQISVWLMNGATVTQNLYVDTVTDTNWRVVASADFDNDQSSDILWRHGITGQISMWLMDGHIKTANLYVDTVTNPNWRIVGNADYDGDNNSDLLWRHESTGQILLWRMQGAKKLSIQYVDTVSNANWKIKASADFDGDSRADILWRHESSGQIVLWLMNGATKSANLYVDTVTNPDWKMAAIGDFDADNSSDILWRHASTGQISMWLMSGANIVSNLYVDTVSDTSWEIMVGKLRGSSGLNRRPLNLSCIAPDQPTANTSIDTVQVYAGLGSFDSPLALVHAPNDMSQWFLAEKGGVVYRFENATPVSNRSVFVDLSTRVDSTKYESGLLGIAFHPDYASNRYVYISYTAVGPNGTYELTSRLSRFRSLDNGLTLDAGTETLLMSLDQRYTNHNGGNIAFGPDGYLYFGLGDAGSGGDPDNRAQNTANLFGTIVRIDVNSGSPYGIPPDNPFVGNALCDVSTTGLDSINSCPEIYAWGMRNPWRWSFDTSSGTLWLGDVGQSNREEVNNIERNGNYGWNVQEGLACYPTNSACSTSGLVQPVLDYGRNIGQSITGGFVYRGTAIPELIGRYIFADFATGKIFATTSEGDGNVGFETLADTSFLISSFGQDLDGELYFLDYSGGTIRKIIQFGGASNATVWAKVSESGCNSIFDITVPGSEMIPYVTNESFWSDNADKERFYAIPDGTTVDIDLSGDWHFPIGTVLVKNFRLSGSLVETRQLMRHTNGTWSGYTFEWNDNETEAHRVVGGKTKNINGQSWTFPSETQCMTCHTSIAGYTLGVENLQLNRDFLYPTTGITANQLVTADTIDVLTDPLPDHPNNIPSLSGVAGGGRLVDFNIVVTDSYSNQDEHSNVTVEDGGLSLVLVDNTARKSIETFNITAETILEFDFVSSSEGEIHGIGFDENNEYSDDARIFVLYGTQILNGTILDFNDYIGSTSKHYSIPVGQYYSDGAMHLVFWNDNDISPGLGTNSRFSNVMIHESPIQNAGEPSIKDRVRSYLHVNCSGCHRPLGPTQSDMDLRFDTTWSSMNVCDSVPLLGNLGVADARIIAPGDASRSILVNRMNRRDAYGMPPLGSHLVDTAGVELMTTWIEDLLVCP